MHIYYILSNKFYEDSFNYHQQLVMLVKGKKIQKISKMSVSIFVKILEFKGYNPIAILCCSIQCAAIFYT